MKSIEKTCNDCYLSMQNCHDMSICCEDEEKVCDNFEALRCGNCSMFSDEDMNGDGFCEELEAKKNCDEMRCKRWKSAGGTK